MHNHFDQYLNVKELILKYRPQHIVELGAANGENTMKLASLLKVYDFKLTVISDNDVLGGKSFDDEPEIFRANFIKGISYKELEKMEENSIDFCIIDTDHNYWTLSKELTVLDFKLKKDGLVCMHDLETFYFNTGVSLTYDTGDLYPLEEIENVGVLKGSLGNAVVDFLYNHRYDYKILRFTDESHGAMALQKVMCKVFAYFATAKTDQVDKILKNRNAVWSGV